MQVNETKRARVVIVGVLMLLLVAGLLASPVAAAPPAASPTLVSPTTGDTASANPTFKWERIADAVKYRFQISTSPAFSTFVYNTDTYSTQNTPPTDLPLGILYWRVAGMDASTAGPFSDSSFEKTKVQAPVPVAPDDSAVLTYPDDPPIFSWQPVQGVKTYRVEIDDAADFIGAQVISTNNTHYALPEPQTIGQPFYWRVQGVSATAGVDTFWSETRSYTIQWPSVPLPLSPPNTTVTSIKDVNLRWTPVRGADRYELQISPNGDWANNVVLEELQLKGTSYSPVLTLNNSSYFWRVRAKDAKTGAPNFGGWSDAWKFTRAWDETPTPISPSGTVTEPTFKFTGVSHSSYYEIQVSTDPNFSPGTFQSCLTTHTEFTPYISGTSSGVGACATFFHTSTFVTGQNYYWRVRGMDAPASPNVNGLWSDPMSFLLRIDSPTLSSPANGAAVTSPDLKWESEPGVSRYKVTILKANGTSAAALEVSANSYTPTTPLKPVDGPFTWYVQAVDTTGRLGLAPHILDRPTFTLVAPTGSASPEPVTPAEGASARLMPSMTWTPVTGATKYEVEYSTPGSDIWTTLGATTIVATVTPHTGYTHPTPLPAGSYLWRVGAFNGTTPIAFGAERSLVVEDLAEVTYQSPSNCVPEEPCQARPETPTMDWNPTADTDNYLVYVSLDRSFTNIVKTYKTQWTSLRPRESFLDSQAGQAYYWFVRPCKIPTGLCGRFDNGVFPNAFAFAKRTAPVDLISPAEGASVPNLVTFDWTDYLETNRGLSLDSWQAAKSYRIHVSTVADFASKIDDKVLDQTTYTPHATTYPEGPLYWRVQAIDGSDNPLTWSATRSLTKSSPNLTLTYPDPGATLTGVPYLRWTPQAYASKYEVEIYKNADLTYSLSNKVATSIVKTASWAPSTSLEAGVFAWRARPLDADARPGSWSEGRLFSLDPGAPALIDPPNDSSFLRDELLFRWDPVAGATQYRIEVSKSPSFATTEENQLTVATSWAPTKRYSDDVYYWRVRAVDAAGNAGPSSETRTFSVSTPAPETTITSTTQDPSPTTTMAFTFTADEPGATFKCSLDGAALATCSSPKSYTNLAQGPHEFSVEATGQEGATDATPATVEWTVATPAPETTIDSAAPTTHPTTSMGFAFSADRTSTFKCSLDGATPATCTSGKAYTSLTQGPHVFTVVATGTPDGVIDPTPATHEWTVATPAPQTTITSGAPTSHPTTSMGFAFESDKTPATFKCSLDGGAPVTCTSGKAYTGLTQGEHVFTVVATVPEGVSDPTPATHEWTVATPAPETTITSISPETTVATSMSFTFASDKSGSAFKCSLDGAPLAPCSTPKPYTGLAQGPHVFTVVATGPEGVVDPTPATVEWTVNSIKISKIVYKAKTLKAEMVNLLNRSTSAVTLTGMSIKNKLNVTHSLAGVSISAGATLRVRTGKGTNTTADRYWKRTKQVWNDIKDTATLKIGTLTASTCSYNNRRKSSKTC